MDSRGIVLELVSGTVRARVEAPILDWARGGWHHVAATLGTNDFCLHLDGVDVACAPRPEGFFREMDVSDRLYVLGSTRRGASGIDETALARARIAGLEAWHHALTPEDVSRRFRSLVPPSVTIQTGAMQLQFGGPEDGFGLVSIRDLDHSRDYSPVAPSRGLFRLRIIARADLHTGFHLRPLDRQLPPMDFPPPPVGHPSASADYPRPSAPPEYSEARDNSLRPVDIQTPWAFNVDSLSVLGGNAPTHGTSTASDGRVLHYFQWTDLPLPDPTEFIAGPTDDDVWATKRNRVVLPYSCQSYTSSSDGDSFCPGDPNRPEAGRIASVTAVLWAVPERNAVQGFLVVDMDSEYWSLAESTFPTFEASLVDGNADVGAHVIVPAPNLGRRKPLNLAPHPTTIWEDFQEVISAWTLYPSVDMAMPFLGIDTTDSGVRSLYLGALDPSGRVRHFPMLRRLRSTPTTPPEAAPLLYSAPSEPRMLMGVSELVEGASLPGNDKLGGQGVVELALVNDGWFGMARQYRTGLQAMGAWPAPLSARSDVPQWMASAGYLLTGSDPATPRQEASLCAASGLPSDLVLFEYRAWDRTNGTSTAVYGKPSQSDDSPWVYPEVSEFLPDFEFLRRAQNIGAPRRAARSFEAVLETAGLYGGDLVPGGAVSLYTNPAYMDLGRNWAVSREISPAFERASNWPYRSEKRAPVPPENASDPLDSGEPHDPNALARIAFSATGEPDRRAGTRTPKPIEPGARDVGPRRAGNPEESWERLQANVPFNEHELYEQSDDYPILSCQANSQPFYICPRNPEQRFLQGQSLARRGASPLDVTRRARVSGIYVDQYSTLPPRTCWSNEHGGPEGHLPGGGAYWTQGWREIIDDARAGMRAGNPDGGVYSEGFSDAFVGHSDGFLIGHESFDEGIPLAIAVYHDAAIFIARHVELSDITFPGPLADLTTAQKAPGLAAGLQRTVGLQAEAFVEGRLPGGLVNNKAGHLESHAYAYVRQLGAWRRSFADSLVYGEMLEPPMLYQVGDAVSEECAVTNSDNGIPAIVDTEAGVSVAGQQGAWTALDSFTMSATAKEGGSAPEWQEPTATASLWKTRAGGLQVVIASAVTTHRRTVLVAIPQVLGQLSGTASVLRHSQSGAVVESDQLPFFLNLLLFEVSLPACGVAVLSLEPNP